MGVDLYNSKEVSIISSIYFLFSKRPSRYSEIRLPYLNKTDKLWGKLWAFSDKSFKSLSISHKSVPVLRVNAHMTSNRPLWLWIKSIAWRKTSQNRFSRIYWKKNLKVMQLSNCRKLLVSFKVFNGKN